jgi:hypothetical protein
MKKKTKAENVNVGIVIRPQPTAFELMMNFQCDLRAEAGLAPLPHWKKTRDTPEWTKNICRKFRNTILKSVLKLRPKNGIVNWRNYGRCIGIMERYKVFLAKDVPKIFERDGLDEVSDEKWAKIQPLMGEEEARQYYLKLLERPADDKASLPELLEIAIERLVVNLEKQKQIAFFHATCQDAKTGAMFMKGIGEGYTAFLNEDGEFSGDDRRANIHLELVAWQYDIEKMRKFVLPVSRKKLFGEIKKLPEFKDKKQNWFDDVCKDINLSMGRVGRPWQFARP